MFFFVFKFVVVLLLVVGGGKVYLPMPPPQPEVSLLYLISDGTFSMLLRSSLNPLSILITSVLNYARNRLLVSILFSSFSGVLICSFILGHVSLSPYFGSLPVFVSMYYVELL